MRPVTLIILILVLVAGCCTATLAQRWSWATYSFASKHFVVYDIDADGRPELIALPSYVIDNYVAIRSPYPHADYGFTVDLDLDKNEELVLQYQSTFYVYKGMSAVTSYSLPGQVNVDPWKRAFAAGNTVVYNTTTITFQDATSPVLPVTTANRLYVAYLARGMLKIADNKGWNVSVYSGDMVSVLGFGLYLGEFYVLGKARLGGSVLVVYNAYRNNVTVAGFTIEFDRVVAFIPLHRAFIATAGKHVYRVYADRVLLECVGDVLWFDGSYMYVYNEEQQKVIMYAPALSKVIAPFSVPAKPAVLGGVYPIIGFSDEAKTYVLVDLPPISVRFTAPSTVYAGERFSYHLDVYNAVNYSLLFNGEPVPTSGYLVINVTGEHMFTVSASTGITTEVREYKIRVLPRPITIRLGVSGTPWAFGRAILTVRVTDGLTGATVKEVSCSLKLGEKVLTVSPWVPVEVELVPSDLMRNTILVEAVCGDGLYYERKAYTDSIYVYAVRAEPDIEYLGEGTIRVRLLAPDNRTEATGEVAIYLNDKYIGRKVLPALITGIPAGNSTIRLQYAPNVPVFVPATYTITVSYYEDVVAVPREALTHVYVADVVKYVNVTRAVEVPTTVTVPVQIPVEVPVLDANLTITIAAIATLAGAAVGIFVPRLLSRRKAAHVEEEPAADIEPA